MKPSVGLTVLISSPIILLTMVVLPALSRPLCSNSVRLLVEGDEWTDYMDPYSIRIRSSLSFSLAFRRMDSILKLYGQQS